MIRAGAARTDSGEEGITERKRTASEKSKRVEERRGARARVFGVAVCANRQWLLGFYLHEYSSQYTLERSMV